MKRLKPRSKRPRPERERADKHERADQQLVRALSAIASGYRAQAEVYQLDEPLVGARLVDRAARFAGEIWPDFRRCVLREVMGSTDLAVAYLLADGGRLDTYPPSGAVEATLIDSAKLGPIAPDERRADRTPLHRELRRLAHALAKPMLQPDEELIPEAVFETKGRAVTLKGKTGRTALFEVVGAFRRHVAGLPVLGRASVHVKLGASPLATGFGVDWRRVERVITKTDVISPDEAAKRVLAELASASPEGPSTARAFKPRSFELGYVSSARRAYQRNLQPAWVAVLDPTGAFGTGKVIAVPAARAAFGALIESVRPVGVRQSAPEPCDCD